MRISSGSFSGVNIITGMYSALRGDDDMTALIDVLPCRMNHPGRQSVKIAPKCKWGSLVTVPYHSLGTLSVFVVRIKSPWQPDRSSWITNTVRFERKPTSRRGGLNFAAFF